LKGFGARGEGTLTSQLIVLKNVNNEMLSYQDYILKIYEKVKKENRSDFINFENNNNNNNNWSYKNYDDDYDYDYELTKKSPTIKKNNKRRRHAGKTFEEEDDKKLRDLFNTLVYNKQTGQQLYKMMPHKSVENISVAFNSLNKCKYNLGLDKNYEFYFNTPQVWLKSLERAASKTKFWLSEEEEEDVENENEFSTNYTSFNNSTKQIDNSNLLNLNNLKFLCDWDDKIVSLTTRSLDLTSEPCYFSLPHSIALLNNKTSCQNLEQSDVDTFVYVINECRDLYDTGILYAAVEELKPKSKIITLLSKNDPIGSFVKLPQVEHNICFEKNLVYIIYEYLIDKNFVKNSQPPVVKTSGLLIMKDELDEHFDQNRVYNFYLNHFHQSQFKMNMKHNGIDLVGINLAGIRQEAAMRIISDEMILIALAISFIVIVTLLYLKSIFISLIVNLSVAMSVGVAFFAYRIVFDIDLFPFINMMAAFLLIGIACDDVYVLFDTWYSEKAKVIMHDLPMLMEKQNLTFGKEQGLDEMDPVEEAPNDDDDNKIGKLKSKVDSVVLDFEFFDWKKIFLILKRRII
jgi:hypothetical protein